MLVQLVLAWSVCLQANLYPESHLSLWRVITNNFLLSLRYRHGKEVHDGKPGVPSNIATAILDGRKTNSDLKWKMVGKGQRSFQGDHVTCRATREVDSWLLLNGCLHREKKAYPLLQTLCGDHASTHLHVEHPTVLGSIGTAKHYGKVGTLCHLPPIDALLAGSSLISVQCTVNSTIQ